MWRVGYRFLLPNISFLIGIILGRNDDDLVLKFLPLLLRQFLHLLRRVSVIVVSIWSLGKLGMAIRAVRGTVIVVSIVHLEFILA